jgi:hypothetical protein
VRRRPRAPVRIELKDGLKASSHKGGAADDALEASSSFSTVNCSFASSATSFASSATSFRNAPSLVHREDAGLRTPDSNSTDVGSAPSLPSHGSTCGGSSSPDGSPPCPTPRPTPRQLVFGTHPEEDAAARAQGLTSTIDVAIDLWGPLDDAQRAHNNTPWGGHLDLRGHVDDGQRVTNSAPSAVRKDPRLSFAALALALVLILILALLLILLLVLLL